MTNLCDNGIIAVCSNNEFKEITEAFKEKRIDWPPTYDGIDFGRNTMSFCTPWSPTPLDEGYMEKLSLMYPSAFFEYDAEVGETGDETEAFICGGNKYEKRQNAIKKYISSVESEVQRFLNQSPKKSEGLKYSVEILDDGSVSSEGENIFGECNVAGLKDAVQVSCGNRHTVVLQKDGKIYACGSNANGQCDIEKAEKKAVKVSCGRYHTAILNEDGTVTVLGKLTPPSAYNKLLDKMEDIESESPTVCEAQFNSNDKVDYLKVGQKLRAEYIKYDPKYRGYTTVRIYDSANNEVAVFFKDDYYSLNQKYVETSIISIEYIQRIEGRRKYARLGIKFEKKPKKSILNRLENAPQTRHRDWTDIVDICSVYDGLVGKTSNGEYLVCGSIPGDVNLSSLFGDNAPLSPQDKEELVEKIEEVRDKYNPDSFLKEMQSNPGYTIWAAFELTAAAMLDMDYNVDTISGAQEAMESDEYNEILNIDLFGLSLYSQAFGEKGSEMMIQFMDHLIATAQEKEDKADFIRIMDQLRQRVTVNRKSFLEVADLVSSLMLKLGEEKDDSDPNDIDLSISNNPSKANTVSESKPAKSESKAEVSEEFEIEGTVLKKYLGNSKKVKIPEGITKICASSFYGKNFVEEIEFPETIQELDYSILSTEWYKNIKDTLVIAHDDIVVNFPVTEPKAVLPENAKVILKVTDSNNILTDVSIPSGVKYLGSIFSGFKKLKRVDLANGIEELKYSFSGCSQIRNITLPNTLKKLDGAFSGCLNLKSVELPESLTEITGCAFKDCKRLSEIKFNKGLKYIGWSTFEGCLALTSVEIPDSVERIAFEAFKGCTELESVVLPNGLKKLESDTFRGCAKLKHIVVPSSLEEIDETAFTGCTALKASMRKKDYDTKNITAGSLKSFFSDASSENQTRYFPSPKEEETIQSLKESIKICDKMEALKNKLLSEAPKEYLQAMDGLDKQIDDVISSVKEISTIKDDDEALLQFIRDNKTQDFKLLEDTLRGLCTQMDEICNSYSPIWNKEKSGSSDSANTKSSPLSNSSSSNSSGGCYVATCVYGSYDCPQVWTLRRFRDYTLAKTWYGRLFIALYYAISPHIVKAFGKTKWFNNLWRPVLDKMVDSFRRNEFDCTRYDDLN